MGRREKAADFGGKARRKERDRWGERDVSGKIV
jgi:hypothetical protein